MTRIFPVIQVNHVKFTWFVCIVKYCHMTNSKYSTFNLQTADIWYLCFPTVLPPVHHVRPYCGPWCQGDVVSRGALQPPLRATPEWCSPTSGSVSLGQRKTRKGCGQCSHEVHEAFEEQNQFRTRNQVLFVAKFPVFLCCRVHVKACSNTEVECLEIAMTRLSTQAASTGQDYEISSLGLGILIWYTFPSRRCIWHDQNKPWIATAISLRWFEYLNLNVFSASNSPSPMQ